MASPVFGQIVFCLQFGTFNEERMYNRDHQINLTSFHFHLSVSYYSVERYICICERPIRYNIELLISSICLEPLPTGI